MAFKVTDQRDGQGALGAGELAPEKATHEFRATNDEGDVLFSGVTDGQDHDDLRAWARAAHGAQVALRATDAENPLDWNKAKSGAKTRA